jgi:hypothetical protein
MSYFGQAYHSEGATEYHIYDECTIGSAISPQDRHEGKGEGLSLCGECDRIHSEHQRDADRIPRFM